jgi:D-alanine-D-alanine ligase
MLFEMPELRALVFWEVKFTDADPGFWPIITYDAKWKPGSRDFESTPMDYKPDISPRLRSKLERLGKKAFRLLGCRDFARVDFRVTPDDDPYILEMNPNPDFSPLAGLSDGLDSTGVTHAQLTRQLVDNALARGALKLAEPIGVELIEW